MIVKFYIICSILDGVVSDVNHSLTIELNWTDNGGGQIDLQVSELTK